MDLEPEPGELPPGYPMEYQREEVLRDGRRVFIRPILPGDAAELAEAIKTADADTLHRRFLGGPPPVTPQLLAHLTVVDYVRRFALVAIDVTCGKGSRSPGMSPRAMVWRRSRSQSGPRGDGWAWGRCLSRCSPRLRRSAASTLSALPTWLRTGRSPRWSRMSVGWASRSSCKGSPSTRAAHGSTLRP